MPKIMDGKLIDQRIARVREIMCKNHVNVYVIGTGDYHMSEYAGDYFAERQFISGFTGSAGTVVITEQESALFTDGRYFVQAQLQIEASEMKLMKIGCKNVPTLEHFCGDKLPLGGCIGFDGRTIGASEGLRLQKEAEKKDGTLNDSFDAVEQIWKDRPAFPHTKVYELPVQYAGESRAHKLAELKAQLRQMQADWHVICTLDDICWLLNLRASDVECNPVMMSYLAISKEQTMLYIEKDRLDKQILDRLMADGITLCPYDQVYADMHNLTEGTVLIDPQRVNMKLYRSFQASVTRMLRQNPTVLLKAKKNAVELRNLREIHIQDGLAVTKFMYWLKQQMAAQTAAQTVQTVQSAQTAQKVQIVEATQDATCQITEYTAAKYLDKLRSQIKGYLDLSFDTISAYNANAAMLHYSASEDNCAVLKPEGMLLVDSGGQYLQGTTDITRTFALGPVTDQMKKHFTLTLKGMLNLGHAHFLKGCTGFNLDILARQPLWEEGIDYRCGTGHGVGYMLNVHESPNGFRWKHNPGVNDLCVFEEGMVTSNEPGVYLDGEYGIRIENMMVCQKDYENEYGEFMKFEMLTFVPIDLDLVDVQYLDKKDIQRLNEYHAEVFEQLSPYLEGEELEFLKKYTRSVQ